MSDPLTWSPIRLGRWFGTAVRVHVLLIAFVAMRLMFSAGSAATEGRLAHLSHTASWLGLLLVALALPAAVMTPSDITTTAFGIAAASGEA